MNNNDQHGNYDTFAFDQFEVRGFFSSRGGHNRSVLGRLVNNLLKALNEHTILPRLITVVMDDDVIREIKPVESRGGTSEQIEILLNWLIREFEQSIESYKDVIPNKAKRSHIPHVLWMCPPNP